MKLLKLQIQIMEEKALNILKASCNIYPTEEQKIQIRNSLRSQYPDFFSQEDNFLQSYQVLKEEASKFDALLGRMRKTVVEMRNEGILPKNILCYIPTMVCFTDYSMSLDRIRGFLYQKYAKDMQYLKLLNIDETKLLIREIIYTTDTRKKNFDQILRIVLDECKKRIDKDQKKYFA